MFDSRKEELEDVDLVDLIEGLYFLVLQVLPQANIAYSLITSKTSFNFYSTRSSLAF